MVKLCSQQLETKIKPSVSGQNWTKTHRPQGEKIQKVIKYTKPEQILAEIVEPSAVSVLILQIKNSDGQYAGTIMCMCAIAI